MAAMFDLAIGCTPMLLDPQRKSATQQLSITFQRPTLGNRVWCEAFLQHAGRSTLSCAAEIIDEWGVVWARHGIGQARPRQLVRGPPGPFLRGAPGGG